MKSWDVFLAMGLLKSVPDLIGHEGMDTYGAYALRFQSTLELIQDLFSSLARRLCGFSMKTVEIEKDNKSIEIG